MYFRSPVWPNDDKNGVYLKAKKYEYFTAGDILVALLPFFGLISVNIVGQLYLHEVVLLILFPFLLIKRNYLILSNGFSVIVIIFGCLWLGSQIATDYFRESQPEDYLRGWAKIIFFLISFGSMIMLMRTPRRVLVWVSASAIPAIISPFIMFSDNLDPSVLWKFGLGSGVLSILTIPLYWRYYKFSDDGTLKKMAVVCLLFGFLSFFMNARSLAGMVIFSSGLVLLYIRYKGNVISMSAVGIALGGALIAAMVLISLYSFGAQSGFFGLEAKEKYESQVTNSGILGVIIGGRAEVLVSTEAIKDSPLLGHGSWAKDYKYIRMLIELKRNDDSDGADDIVITSLEGLIPTHSYLTGAWVEAGFLGGVFWIVVLALCFVYATPASFRTADVLGLFALWTIPAFTWSILFSPFGADVRVSVATLLSIFALVIERAADATAVKGTS